MDFEKQKALNEEHAEHPQAGDYWSEMFMPCYMIIKADDHFVTFCDEMKKVDENHWTWDFQRGIKETTIEAFSKKVHYNSIPGCWCWVTPGGMQRYLAAMNEELNDKNQRARSTYVYE
jgi:hypothetical protein